MGKLVYMLVMHTYGWAIGLFAVMGHRKAQGWKRMRRGSVSRLAEATENLPGGQRWMWFHCASVGEFEQARPVMEAWRNRHPQDAFLLTFYSFSGWDAFAKRSMPGWRETDHVSALPLDTPGQVRPFLDAAQGASGASAIRGALLAKYDVWPVWVEALNERSVPVGLFAAHVIPGRWPFRMGGQFHRRAWSVLSLILVQTESSVAALSDHGLAAEATGDPRFDRVLQSVEAHEADAALERWVNNRPCLVAGSAWAPECEAAREAWIPGRCAVVVPHEWTESWVASESKKWKEAGARPVVWSVERGDDARTELSEADVLIVDTVGELLGLYAVADVALVGGGFGAGVHNTLEPAAYGAFILVGPQVGRFREVKELQRAGGLEVCADRKELVNRLHAVWNTNLEVAESGARAQAYARSNQGAGERIARAWEKRLEGEGSSHDLG